MKFKLFVLFPFFTALFSASLHAAQPFLCSDSGAGRIAVFDSNSTLVWQQPLANCYEVKLLSDGNLLATWRGTKGFSVGLMTPQKEMLWEYPTDSEVFGADILQDGNFIVGECSSGIISILDKSGKKLSSFKTTFKTGGHSNMRHVTSTPQNTILVGHIGDKKVREYDLKGNLVKEFSVPGNAYVGHRLVNGHTLIGHQNGVSEFSPDGKIVWQLSSQDVPQVDVQWITDVKRLANGNTLICNWLGHGGRGKSLPLFEVSPDKKMVWSLPAGDLVKDLTSISPLTKAEFEKFQQLPASSRSSNVVSSKPNSCPSVVTQATLRQAIEAMIAEFGDRYPQGQTFLTQLSALGEDHPLELEKLAQDVFFANPLLCNHPILFTTRHQYRPDHHNTETMFQTGEINHSSYVPGGAMKTIDFKQGGKVTELINPGAEGLVRDPEISFDGHSIIFSLRKNKNDNYHIYTMSSNGSNLKQLTGAPGVTDIDPLFLPDGGIIFSSTREPKYCMCNRHIMCNLFRMEFDGANIQQIGKSTLFEGHSTLLPDGRILYDRWEYVDRNFGDAQGLWVVNTDGTNHAIYWGNNTSSPGGVIDARAIPGTQNVIAVLAGCHDRPWGALGIIDRQKGMDGPEPVLRTWPKDFHKNISTEGSGRWDSPMRLTVKYEDPYPLNDKYFLVSRTLGQGEKTGLFILDHFGNEILLHQEAGFGCYDPMPLGPKPMPPARPQNVDYTKATGIFYLQNVYEGTHMKNVKPGEIKSLRIVESPEKQNWTRGAWGGQGTQSPGMNWSSFENKRILGTVPVAEDGSAMFEVPADKFIFFQALDKDGRMIQTMRSGTIIRPGETQSCVGCHENRLSVPDAKMGQTQASRLGVSKLAGIKEPSQPFSYRHQVQPIFDKHCVSCHDFGKKEGEILNLAGDLNNAFNTSYVDLWSKRYINCIGGGPAALQPAKSWGSNQSKLIQTLLKGHEDVKLSPEEMNTLCTWIDLNGPYYPVYESAYPNNPFGQSPLTNAEFKRLKDLTGAKFAENLGFKGTDPASFTRPELSPCLNKLTKDSEAYKEALGILKTGQQRLKENPRADMDGFKPSLNDQKRIDKYLERSKIEASIRAAITTSKKIYDPGIERP